MSDKSREVPPLFPADHVRLTPIPDALAPYSKASHSEQMRRVRVVLEGVRSLCRRRFATLSAALELVSRGNHSPAAVEGARRLLRAVAGTVDLGAWEISAGRACVSIALEAALCHCSPDKRRWLSVARP